MTGMTREEAMDEMMDSIDGAVVALDIAVSEFKRRKPKQRKHWIKVDKHTVKCSKCGNYLDRRGVNAGRGDINYCPNCGSKMDEVKE